MGVVARQGFKASVLSYFGVGLGAIITLWLYPKLLSPMEIGLITILVNVSMLMAPIGQLGVTGAIIKFLPQYKGDPEKHKSFMLLVALIAISGILLATGFFFAFQGFLTNEFIENSPEFVDFLYLIIPLGLLIVLLNLAEAYARALLRIAVPKLFRDVGLRLLTISLVVIYSLWHLDREWLLTGIVGCYSLTALMLLYYINRLNPLKIGYNLRALDRPVVREVIIFSLFFVLGGFANIIVTKIDTWMITSMIDLENTGIYAIALYIGMAIEIPKRAVNLISMPLVGMAMKENDLDKVKGLYKKASLNLLIVGSFFMIGIWSNIDALFELMPKGDVFASGKYVVLFIGISVLIDMGMGINSEIIVMSKFYRYNFLILASLIGLTIVNNHIFIPIYGITGAALASAISILVFNVIKFVVVYYKLGLQPFTSRTLIVLALGGSVFALGQFLPDLSSPIFSILYKSVVLTVLYVGLVVSLKVSEDLNQAGKTAIDRVNKMIGRGKIDLKLLSIKSQGI